jgi:hypothetical protein
MAWWEDPGGPSRGAVLREAARIGAVVVAALAAGAGLVFLITQVVAPAQRLSLPAQGRGVAASASPTASPAAALPTLPPVPVPAAPPTADASTVPDRYLGDLTTAPGTLPGEIDGPDYRFAHGFGLALGASTRVAFVVPNGYQSLTATLKGVGGTIQFTLTVGGRPVLDRTLSPLQPPVTVTCAVPAGSTLVLSALFQGGGSLRDAVALWGDARFSPSPAPAPGCS